MGNTKISWTEKSWNVVTGCTKVSEGCKNCYAETIAKRFWKDRKFTDVQCHPERLEQPLHWKKPSMVFVNSMSDLFHKEVPSEFIYSVLGIMATAKQHIFQVLTKRPERMLDCYANTSCLNNVWLGVSVENQEQADKRIPLLLETPAKVRWISAEPLLSGINLEHFLPLVVNNKIRDNGIDWIVVGCESGNKRREYKLEWIESIVEQSKSAGVPVFVKQISIGGKVIKDINLFPEHLRIREYPKGELK